jgi:hypothetical protein
MVTALNSGDGADTGRMTGDAPPVCGIAEGDTLAREEHTEQRRFSTRRNLRLGERERESSMSDAGIHDHIEALVAEEHRLLNSGTAEPLGPADRQRLDEIKVRLDQLWDLLRQRQAHTEFGLDPNATSTRDAATVEGYEQ